MSDKKELILKALERQGITHKIPGTDIEVLLVPLPGWLRLKIQDAQIQNQFKLSDYIYDIITECILDPDTGNKIFTKADIPLLNSKDLSKLEPLVIRILTLSNVSQEELQDLQEELKKTTT